MILSVMVWFQWQKRSESKSCLVILLSHTVHNTAHWINAFQSASAVIGNIKCLRISCFFNQILFLKVWGMQMCDIVWYPSHLCNWYSTSQLSTRGSGPNILVFDISKLQQSREAAGQRLFLAVLPPRRRPMLQPFSKTYTPWISFLRKRRPFFKLEAC